MIDETDLSDSTLRALLWSALKKYSTAELLELVHDSDYIVRTAAAKQLHFRPEPAVFNCALNLCLSSIDYEREIAAFILGQLGVPKFPYKKDSLNILIELMSDDCNEVSVAAITALGHLGADNFIENQDFVQKLFSLASHCDPDIRAAVAFSLSAVYPTKDVIDILTNLCLDQDQDVADWAKVSLDIINDRTEK